MTLNTEDRTENSASSSKANPALEFITRLWHSWSFHDRLMVCGSAAFGILTWFPWVSISTPLGNFSAAGFNAWYVKVACFLSFGVTALMLFPDVRKKLEAVLPEQVRSYLMVGLTGLVVLLGPIIFMTDAPSSMWAFFMWIAFAAAGASAAGAALKRFGT